MGTKVQVLGGDAIHSQDGRFRYWLMRRVREGERRCLFVLLNGSKAGAEIEDSDPTVDKLIKYTWRWGYDIMELVNAFGLMATDPKGLKIEARDPRLGDPVGPENDHYIREAVIRVVACNGAVVCGWGNHGSYLGRSRTVLGIIRDSGANPLALEINNSGEPKHPLYCRDDQQLVRL